MKTEAVKIAQLELDPNNVRTHDPRSLEAIRRSLDEFGQRKPIVITDANVVVTGNGTVQAAQALGWADIIAVRIPKGWADEKVRAFAIADNRTSELSTFDTAKLLEQLTELADVQVVGFSQEELDDLIEFRLNPFKTTRMSISDLVPHPENYQLHPDNQLEQIIESIRLHGFYRNIVVASDNVILAGHGVVQAAKKMGKKRVPVIQLELDSKDPNAYKVMTSDNEINNLAKVNDRALTELLKNLLELEGNGALMGTGFDENQLAALAFTSRPASELQNQDAVAEWVGMAEWEQKPEYPELSIKFDDEQARTDFMEMIGSSVINKKFGRVWAVWYPERRREDLINLKFEETNE